MKCCLRFARRSLNTADFSALSIDITNRLMNHVREYWMCSKWGYYRGYGRGEQVVRNIMMVKLIVSLGGLLEKDYILFKYKGHKANNPIIMIEMDSLVM